MPALQFSIKRARNRKNLANRTITGAQAQHGRDKVLDDAGVKGVAADRNSGGAQNLSLRPSPAQADQAEVTGAASKVRDEDEFLMVQTLGIGVGSTDGLVFEKN